MEGGQAEGYHRRLLRLGGGFVVLSEGEALRLWLVIPGSRGVARLAPTETVIRTRPPTPPDMVSLTLRAHCRRLPSSLRPPAPSQYHSLVYARVPADPRSLTRCLQRISGSAGHLQRTLREPWESQAHVHCTLYPSTALSVLQASSYPEPPHACLTPHRTWPSVCRRRERPIASTVQRLQSKLRKLALRRFRHGLRSLTSP